jgi:hypothetical protein
MIAIASNSTNERDTFYQLDHYNKTIMCKIFR